MKGMDLSMKRPANYGKPSYEQYKDENGNSMRLEPDFNGKYWAHPGMIPHMKFEEYAPKFKDFYYFKNEDGILEARWHTEGKSVIWTQPLHRAIWQLCMYVGQDRDVECFIFGGSGDEFIHGQDPNRLNDEEHLWWMTYENMYYDGCNDCEGIVFDVEVPTIGCLNGEGWHFENQLFADVTLMAEDAFLIDPHYFVNMVPGDGIQIALRMCMGIKRANYMMLMNEKIDSKKALDYGLVNEVVPKAELYDRAWEVARHIMRATEHTRRVTVQVLRMPWKEALSKELRHVFGSEMWMTLTQHPKHSNSGWRDVAGKEDLEIFEDQEH